VIRNYDPKNVRLTWGGIEFKFIDGTFIEVKAVPDRSRYPKNCPRCGAGLHRSVDDRLLREVPLSEREPCCPDDYGGSHYHCPYCGCVSS
jgi:hypothetical protein